MTTATEPAAQKPSPPSQAAAFLTAVRFLTRVPVPQRFFPGEERLSASVAYFPLVGSLIANLSLPSRWGRALLRAEKREEAQPAGRSVYRRSQLDDLPANPRFRRRAC